MSHEVLFLAHRVPYPPNKGDKIRSWRILEYLATRFDVHLAAFVDDPADMKHEAFLETVAASVSLVPISSQRSRIKSAKGLLTGHPLSFTFYEDTRMRRVVSRLRARPLCAEIGFSSSMAPYLTPKIDTRPLLFDLCDADSAKWARTAELSRFPMKTVYSREGRLVAKEEAQIINAADTVFAISEAEAAILRALPGVARSVDWFGNGVDTDYFDPTQNVGVQLQHDVVFTGAMDYFANQNAALWFLRDIWPDVRRRIPNATFAIVGANPGKALMAQNGVDGVTVTGRVNDIRPWLFGARVAIAPMDIARGVQNKVLEAMAAGRAVVSTAAGLEGIDANPGQELIVTDASAAFAEAVILLLEDQEKARTLGVAARKAMIERYTWTTQMTRFGNAIDRLLAA